MLAVLAYPGPGLDEFGTVGAFLQVVMLQHGLQGHVHLKLQRPVSEAVIAHRLHAVEIVQLGQQGCSLIEIGRASCRERV